MPRSIRGRRRVLLRISNRELLAGFADEARASGDRAGILRRSKAAQKSRAEGDFRSGRAGIPYKTGRLRDSLIFEETKAGISITSNLRYWFQAKIAVARWWSRTGKRRFTQEVRSQTISARSRQRQRDQRAREGAAREEVQAYERGDVREHRRLRRNRLARINRARSPELRASRRATRTEVAAFNRAEVIREVAAIRAKRDVRIQALQRGFTRRHTRRAGLLPKYRQREYRVAQRALRTGRRRGRPGTTAAALRVRNLLARLL